MHADHAHLFELTARRAVAVAPARVIHQQVLAMSRPVAGSLINTRGLTPGDFQRDGAHPGVRRVAAVIFFEAAGENEVFTHGAQHRRFVPLIVDDVVVHDRAQQDLVTQKVARAVDHRVRGQTP